MSKQDAVCKPREKHPDWARVEDSIPPKHERVLVYVVDIVNGKTHFSVSNRDYYGAWAGYQNPFGQKVMFWRDLPKPPDPDHSEPTRVVK